MALTSTDLVSLDEDGSTGASTLTLVFEAPPPPRRQPAGTRRPTQPRKPPRVPPGYIAPDTHRPHGSYVKYKVEDCRCGPCTAGNREYVSQRSRAIQRPDEVWMPYVPATRARRHLLDLRRQGIGYKTVASVTGLSPSAVGKILWPTRYRGMGRSQRIRRQTEQKILAFRPEHAAGGQKVDPTVTWQMLDDLIARGFTRTWIAQQVTSPNARSLQIKRTLVRASTARRVELLYRSLEGQRGPGRRSRWGHD